MAKGKETVVTPMGEGYGHGGAAPTGHVCEDASSTLKDLPPRDKGAASIPEVIYDENANLPNRSGGK